MSQKSVRYVSHGDKHIFLTKIYSNGNTLPDYESSLFMGNATSFSTNIHFFFWSMIIILDLHHSIDCYWRDYSLIIFIYTQFCLSVSKYSDGLVTQRKLTSSHQGNIFTQGLNISRSKDMWLLSIPKFELGK